MEEMAQVRWGPKRGQEAEHVICGREFYMSKLAGKLTPSISSTITAISVTEIQQGTSLTLGSWWSSPKYQCKGSTVLTRAKPQTEYSSGCPERRTTSFWKHSSVRPAQSWQRMFDPHPGEAQHMLFQETPKRCATSCAPKLLFHPLSISENPMASNMHILHWIPSPPA